jgi:hydrogenase-4 component B
LPLGLVALPGWAALLMVLGVVAVFFGAAAGAVQQDAKAVLAYSSISQMGLMIIGLAIGLAAPEHWPITLAAILLYALHHALAKGALFLGVGVAAAVDAKPWQRLAVGAGLVLPALALAGAPWTSGAAAKTALKTAAKVAPGPWPGWLDWLLPLGAVATTLLMARFLVVVWPRESAAPHPLRPGAVAAWLALLVALFTALWIAPVPVFRGSIHETLSFAALWAGLAPLLLGASLAWLFARSCRARRLHSRLALPPGDLLIPIERLGAAARRRLHRDLGETRGPWLAQTVRLTLGRAATALGEAMTRGERQLARWSVGGALSLGVTALLAYLLLR